MGDSPPNAYVRQIAKGTGYGIAGKVFMHLSNYGTLFLITRILSVTSFGVFTLAQTVAQTVWMIGGIGLDQGMLKHTAQYRAEGDRENLKATFRFILVVQIILGAIIAGALFGAAGWIRSRFYPNIGQELVTNLRLFSPLVLIAPVFFSLLFFLQGYNRVREKILFHDFLQFGLRIILVALVLLLGLEAWGVIGAFVLSTSAALAVAFFYTWGAAPEIRDRSIRGKVQWKAVVLFSLPLLMTSFLAKFIVGTDILMIGHYLSEEDVGIYFVAIRLAVFVDILLQCINPAFTPIIGELYHQGRTAELRVLFRTMARWSLTGALMILLVIACFSDQITGVFGTEYRSASTALLILAVGRLAGAAIGSVGHVFIMSGRSRVVLQNALLITIVNIVLNLILIPRYGIEGAAVATATSYVVVSIVWCLQARRILHLFPLSRSMLKPVAASVAVFGVSLLIDSSIALPQPTLPRVAALAITVMGSYVFLLYLLGIPEEDRDLLRRIRERLTRGDMDGDHPASRSPH